MSNSETPQEGVKEAEGSPTPKTIAAIASSPSSSPHAPRSANNKEMPVWLQYFSLYMGIIITAYVIGVYNPTNIRFLDPRSSRVSCDKGSWSIANLKMEPVPRYRWDQSLPFATQLAAWREPVILSNTFVNKWKALERWSSDDYLRRKPELDRMNETMVVRQCQMKPSNPTSALARSGLVDAPENFYSLNATSALFFSKYNNPDEDSYWYWYGKVTGSLVDDVEPSEGLWVDPQDFEQFGLYMWLSGPDIGPWWHYDQDHNFYVQVAGTKRFILIPPWETPNMHLFPQIHPRNHKSQVDFDHPDFEATPNYANVSEAYIAELKPGEVLYIPPYWWHHVRSHVRSVSLASWSQSGVFRVMRYGLYKRKFAIDELPRGEVRRAAFRLLLQEIALKIYGKDNTFFASLIQQRWDPIRAELEANSKTTNALATEDGGAPIEDLISSLCGKMVGNAKASGNAEESASEDQQSIPEDIRLRILDDVKASVEAFENCQTKSGAGNKGIGKDRRDMKAIRDIEFGDFTEFMLEIEVGAENVLPFLDHCLKSPL